MKIGVISDTHLNRISKNFKGFYNKFLSDLDVLLHAGDFVSLETVEFLDNGNFHGVYGNMDTDDISMRLPHKKVIKLGGFKVGLIHGWGASEGLEERVLNEFCGVDAIVYGHSHQVANHEREGVLLFNPGTVWGYSSKGVNSFGILEINETINAEILEIS